MLLHYNPYDVHDIPGFKSLTPKEQEEVYNKTAIFGCIIYLFAFIIAVAICALFFGCATPRTVVEHHHHHYEADTLAVRAQVDRQLSSWHEDMTQYFQQRLEEYSASWSSHEDQKEVITELITVTTDSIGREIRTEQRTANRSMVNSQWSMVNSITQEYEARLRMAVDSLDGIFQQRFDSLAAHQTSDIDHQTSSTPSAIDHRPWYQRWWEHVKWLVVGAVLAVLLLATRRWWIRLFRDFRCSQ